MLAAVHAVAAVNILIPLIYRSHEFLTNLQSFHFDIINHFYLGVQLSHVVDDILNYIISRLSDLLVSSGLTLRVV
jgi:hypothetical protein